MKPEEIKIEDIKVLPSTPPEGSQIVSSMTMEATVDVTPQPLRQLRSFVLAVAAIPPLLPPEARITLQALFSCFEKQKNVSEGLIGDMIWGFAQCNIPPECSYNGLKQLASADYIKFQAKDGSFVDLTSDAAEGAFIRYQKKLLDLVYV